MKIEINLQNGYLYIESKSQSMTIFHHISIAFPTKTTTKTRILRVYTQKPFFFQSNIETIYRLESINLDKTK